jgi:alpha-ketoglutarate-dependent taurine dioxygenase
MTDLTVTPLATTLGAVVDGVDLAADLDAEEISAVRASLLEHKVLFFRKQALDPATQTRLAARFGQPTPAHPVEPSVEGHPEVLSLDSDEGARADVWHSDLTFQERPPLGAILHAVVVPAVGGDTIWSDMTATYDALSPALQQFLETLTATHAASKAGGYFAGRDSAGDKAAQVAQAEPVHHPVVRVHPETDRRSIFVNPLFTTKIDGLRRRESDALLELLQEVAIQPERVVRWRWEAGDVAFWDNRCTMHYALLDYRAARRMERVALEGDEPVGVRS